jgi:hypothetical protein
LRKTRRREREVCASVARQLHSFFYVLAFFLTMTSTRPHVNTSITSLIAVVRSENLRLERWLKHESGPGHSTQT